MGRAGFVERASAPERGVDARVDDLSRGAPIRGEVRVASDDHTSPCGHPDVVRVTVRARPVTRDVWLAVNEDLRASPVVRAVIDFLVESIGPQLS